MKISKEKRFPGITNGSSQRRSSPGEAADRFERMILQNEFTFQRINVKELCCPIAEKVVRAIEEAGLQWELGDKTVGKNFLIKINSDYIEYVDFYPETEQFQFCGKGHSEGIRPSEGFLWLAI